MKGKRLWGNCGTIGPKNIPKPLQTSWSGIRKKGSPQSRSRGTGSWSRGVDVRGGRTIAPNHHRYFSKEIIDFKGSGDRSWGKGIGAIFFVEEAVEQSRQSSPMLFQRNHWLLKVVEIGAGEKELVQFSSKPQRFLTRCKRTVMWFSYIYKDLRTGDSPSQYGENTMQHHTKNRHTKSPEHWNLARTYSSLCSQTSKDPSSLQGIGRVASVFNYCKSMRRGLASSESGHRTT